MYNSTIDSESSFSTTVLSPRLSTVHLRVRSVADQRDLLLALDARDDTRDAVAVEVRRGRRQPAVTQVPDQRARRRRLDGDAVVGPRERPPVVGHVGPQSSSDATAPAYGNAALAQRDGTDQQ